MATPDSSTGKAKPVNSILLYLLTGAFAIGMSYMLISFIVISWADRQISEALHIRETGHKKYEMVIDAETTVPLSKKQTENLLAFNECDWLPEEQQEFVYAGYAKALEHYPAKIYLDMYSIDESGWLLTKITLPLLVPVIAYMILFFSLDHRAWKSVQPINQMDCPSHLKIPTPGKGVGYLFIPFYSIYWVFSSLSRLVKAGKFLSDRYGISYQGPTSLLVTVFGMVFSWNSLTYKLDFPFLSPAWYMDVASMAIFLFALPLLSFRLQKMIASLSAAAPSANAQPGQITE